jgi:hypothetical protein
MIHLGLSIFCDSKIICTIPFFITSMQAENILYQLDWKEITPEDSKDKKYTTYITIEEAKSVINALDDYAFDFRNVFLTQRAFFESGVKSIKERHRVKIGLIISDHSTNVESF